MTQRKVIYLTKEEIARVRDIKELCKLAGINEEIRVTTYKGNVRTDKIQPKWELVGTHTGRAPSSSTPCPLASRPTS